LGPLLEQPCPPDIIGGNYYVTSERFLDHRRHRYPAETHGGNGRHVYADVETVRVLADWSPGPASLLEEAWQRYGRPVAITEAHLGSTPNEQVRWLSQVWQEANWLLESGVDIRAVTIWSLLGAWNWHCLVTREDGHYEPGVFDIRGSAPRPTPLATLARSLAAGELPGWKATSRPGWWERPERLLYPPVDQEGNDVLHGDGRRSKRALDGAA
jgi:dTDP-4-dehydrorhamnose reductase